MVIVYLFLFYKFLHGINCLIWKPQGQDLNEIRGRPPRSDEEITKALP